MTPIEPAVPDAGLCTACRYLRRVRTERGSTFAFCNLSQTNDQFPRYPHLPVLSCSGYEPNNEEPHGSEK
ncbi:MAG: hypothetical protein O2954_08750, partial [bacterium]|nr:hypothetical protein [bacterium]